MRRNCRSIRVDQMAAALAAGKKTTEIAAMYGVTRQAVQKAGKNRGVRPKWGNGKPSNKARATSAAQRP